jgi:hypothetical protein
MEQREAEKKSNPADEFLTQHRKVKSFPAKM